MARRLGRQHSLEVVTHHQTGDGGVATEELVGDRNDADVGTLELVNQRRDDAGGS